MVGILGQQPAIELPFIVAANARAERDNKIFFISFTYFFPFLVF
jgi:hypothetical protein